MEELIYGIPYSRLVQERKTVNWDIGNQRRIILVMVNPPVSPHKQEPSAPQKPRHPYKGNQVDYYA